MFTYTFIIPHHNSPDLLNRCLDSIPQREDIQIIVVDDNSNENLQPKLSRTDINVINIDAEHTKGAGHARNVGLENAKGKWMLFADCDDYYSKGFLDVLDKYSNCDIDVLYFNYTHIDGDDNSIYQDNKLQIILNKQIKDESDIIFIKYRNNTPWNKMIKRKFVEDNKLHFEEVVNGNDVLFSLMVAQNSKKVAVLSYRLYNYIRTANSLGTKKQSISELVCRMEHTLKHNKYNTALGHSEWNSSTFIFLYSIVKEYGLSTSLSVLKHNFYRLSHDKCNVNEWAAMLTKQ